MVLCGDCGRELPPTKRRGRPRKFCEACRPARDPSLVRFRRVELTAQGRVCRVCNGFKQWSEFVRDKHKAAGYASRCKSCDNDRSKRRYASLTDQQKVRVYALARARLDRLGMIPIPRKCKRCGDPALSQKHWYCGQCGEWARMRRRAMTEAGRRYEAERPSSRERGYGQEHRKMRERFARRVDGGYEVCRRCHQAIAPAGFPCPCCGKPTKKGGHASSGFCGWDLGHSDFDRSVWTGPEHACCNRATSAHRKAQAGGRVAAEKWLG